MASVAKSPFLRQTVVAISCRAPILLASSVSWFLQNSLTLFFVTFAAIAVSRDHKPDQTDERQRIEDAGGFVMWAGTWRVGGVLAVTRAFVDRHLKQFVVADPEIHEEAVDGSLEFLILASDGLWDVVTNEVEGRDSCRKGTII
ncbi:hypothetical protein C4D60_Mb03t05470 [Musa balbisiana]|uniref:protein-serine/threonine phosphatase n=1 Tax=Musa balbisiana TaxID=52838 RepID=A0A4S8JA56_MUSBA|nr:hypothetical protein C4D60_Mb03t05470 [Musa balbisiana]